MSDLSQRMRACAEEIAALNGTKNPSESHLLTVRLTLDAAAFLYLGAEALDGRQHPSPAGYRGEPINNDGPPDDGQPTEMQEWHDYDPHA